MPSGEEMSSSQITSRTAAILPSSALRWWAIAASMNRPTAPESDRMYSISGAASRVLSGTMTAPIQGRAYISSK